MAFKTVFLVATSMAASVMGAAINTQGECGTPEPTEEHIAMAKQMSLNETMFSGNSFAAQANVNIPVYVHVVAKDKTAGGGYANENEIRSAITAMTESYTGMGFEFTLKEVDYTVNPEWAANGDEVNMKKKLRKGDYKTLNLYYINDLGGPNGYCYFPTKASTGSTTFIKDGCSIQTDKLNNGQTTPHEVGHWLGLYHTFQGGCEGDGDQVDDTPACERSWSCDKNQDTCPDLPGNDPVTNLMSYGTCREVFTSGQGQRMRSSYDFYRK